MKNTLIILAVLAGLFLLFTFGGGYYMYRFAICTTPKKRTNYWEIPLKKAELFTDAEFRQIQSGERFMKEIHAEKITIESHDGLKLRARFIENPDPVGIILMVHGYRSHPVLDFSCAVEPFYENGFSMLLIDHRAHGESEGCHIGFGALERLDVAQWTHYLKKRFPDLPVILDGVSMGGATVMMSVQADLTDNIPGSMPNGMPNSIADNVKCVIADCGYTTPGAICRKVLYQWFKLPPFPIYYGAKFWVELLAGYDLDGVSAVEALRSLEKREKPLYVCIAHGKQDDFVPYTMAEENYAVFRKDAPNVWFVASETAGHGTAYLKDKQLYTDALQQMYEAAGIPIRKGGK